MTEEEILQEFLNIFDSRDGDGKVSIKFSRYKCDRAI